MVKERETLSEYEAGRYQRQLPLWGRGSVQEHLRCARVLVAVLEDWETIVADLSCLGRCGLPFA